MNEEELSAYLVSLVEGADDAILSCDRRDTIVSWNHGAEKLFGYNRDEVLGRSFEILLPQGRTDQPFDAMERVYRGENVANYEAELVHKNGRHMAVSLTISAVRNNEDQVVGAWAIVHDASRAGDTMLALQRSEAELREVQRVGHVGTWQWLREPDTAVWSEELYRILGHDPALPAFSFTLSPEIFSPDSLQALEVLVNRALNTGQAYDLDTQIRRPDGSLRWVIVRGLPDRDPSGQVTGLRGTVQDITDRKQQEEELRSLNDNLERLVAERTSDLQAVLDAAPIPIWIAHDPECRYITGNRYADRMVMQVPFRGNVSASAVPGEAFVSFRAFHNGRELRPEELPSQVAAVTGKAVSDQEFELLFADGRRATLLLCAAPLFDASGKVRGSVAAGVETTRLRTAESLSNAILNSFSATVAVIGSEGTILMTNDAWNKFAVDNDGRPWFFMAPDENYLQICRRAADDGTSEAGAALAGIEAVLAGDLSSFNLEFPCHLPSQSHLPSQRRWFLMSVSPLKGLRKGAVISHTNITDRKLSEIASQASASTIRGLLESSNQAIVAVDLAAKIVLVDGSTEKMFGYRKDELIGQNLEVLVPKEFRGRHAELRKGYQANPQNRPMGPGLNVHGRKKNGATFPLEVGLSSIETPGGRLAVAFVTDITDRKRLEQAEQEATREVRALASGLLTAQEEERHRVSRDLHDTICQELASLAIEIGGLVREHGASDEEGQRLLRLQTRVVQTAEHTRRIAHELHSSVLDDLGLVDSLRELCDKFSSQALGISLDCGSIAPLGNVSRGLASCIYRVAQESLRNVIKHSAAKHAAVELKARKRIVRLIITDDGKGFDPTAVRARKGLGLIGMKERARLVGGKVTVTSAHGAGTRITLDAPLSTPHHGV